jgi:enoyl-CoA hydratase/carnithine racemase
MPRSFVASNRIAWLHEAQRIGLVSYSYPQEKLQAEALKLATKITSLLVSRPSPNLLVSQAAWHSWSEKAGAARPRVHGSIDLPVEEALALSAKYRYPLNETEDFAEGLLVSGSE